MDYTSQAGFHSLSKEWKATATWNKKYKTTMTVQHVFLKKKSKVKICRQGAETHWCGSLKHEDGTWHEI